MPLQSSRRGVLVSLGLAATAGTALLSPQRRDGSLDLARTIPEETWPGAGYDSARTKHVSGATPPTTDARIAWEASIDVSHWNPSLAIDEEAVYVPEQAGLTALDRSDGTERWRFETATHWPPDGDELRVGPLVVGDRVLVATDEGLLGIDAGTGRLEWVHSIGGPPDHAVLVGEAVFLPDRTDAPGIVAIDARSGARWSRWSTEQFWSPVAFIDQYLVGYASGALAAFRPRTGERVWRADTPGDVSMPTTAIAGDVHVVVGSNPLVALDTGDGTETWRYEARTGEDQVETFQPATDGARVYVSAYWAGETVAFDARTGERVWQVDESLGSPIVAGETVYCFDEDRVTALRASDGRRRGQFGRGLVRTDGVAETLAAAGDRLYAAFAPDGGTSARATVFALEAP